MSTSPLSQQGSSSTQSLEELVFLIADTQALASWVDTQFCHSASRNLVINPATLKSVLTRRSASLRELAVSMWQQALSVLSSDCRAALTAVKSIAARFRMTNKPPPDSASPYVQTILQPLGRFMEQYSVLAPPEVGQNWALEVADAVAKSFLDQVLNLLETVTQMDNALQRRSKLSKDGGGKGKMRDSDKILLQLWLDVRDFVSEASRVSAGRMSEMSSTLTSLEASVSDGARLYEVSKG